MMRAAAAAAGLAPSQWLRQAIAAATLGPSRTRVLADSTVTLRAHNARLLGLGRNLNQLTRAVHSGRAVTVPEGLLKEVLTCVEDAREATLKVHSALRSVSE